MKKISFLVLIAMILSLNGCGSSPTIVSESNETVTQEVELSTEEESTNETLEEDTLATDVLIINSEEESTTSTTDEENSTIENPKPESINVGFGGACAFPFTSKDEEELIWVSAKDLVLDEAIASNDYYAEIKVYDPDAFSTLQSYLKKSKYVVFWITKGWEESWFNLDEIQTLIDSGYTPVFNYWYFGDTLLNGLPDDDAKEAYNSDAKRVSDMLASLSGEVLLVLEPEFNKESIVKDEETQHLFANILQGVVDIFKTNNSNLLLGLSMMDTGKRNVNEVENCGYEQCALGDKEAWEKPEIVYEDLLESLDFVAFNQMLASFSRDYENPGDWDNPNPRNYSDEELGIDYFADRMVNFSTFLNEKYHKLVFMPYMAIATATWSDEDEDGEIDENEVSKSGWVDRAESVYRTMRDKRESLKDAGLFGYATMALFDDPRHDYGGYQYFMNNEYHLGIVETGAQDEVDSAAYGDLTFKGEILSLLFGE